MTYRDSAQLYRQLSATTRAGIPTGLALSTLVAQTQNRALKKRLNSVSQAVWQGTKMSEALASCPRLFDEPQRAIITTGETVGRLDTAFDELAADAERSASLQDSLKRELQLPKITLVCTLPFLPMFFGPGSPVMASVIVVFLLTLFCGVLLLQPILLRTQTRQNLWVDLLTLRMPVLGKVVLLSVTARFARSLAMLHRAGLEATQATRLAANACGNQVIAGKLRQAIPRLERGMRLQEALKATGVFPPYVVDTVGVGETAGRMDALLDCIADYHEQELALRLHQIAVGLGVTALLAVGVLVGIVCIKFYAG